MGGLPVKVCSASAYSLNTGSASGDSVGVCSVLGSPMLGASQLGTCELGALALRARWIGGGRRWR